MIIPGLRSPHVKTGGIFYFARMLDKIRLHAAGTLPADYVENLGTGFDGYCVRFLWIEYPALVEKTKAGGTDQEILAWAWQQGRKPSDEEIMIWNEFMRKRGWNDDATERFHFRMAEGGYENHAEIQTMFQYIDLDEGLASA